MVTCITKFALCLLGVVSAEWRGTDFTFRLAIKVRIALLVIALDFQQLKKSGLVKNFNQYEFSQLIFLHFTKGLNVDDSVL